MTDTVVRRSHEPRREEVVIDRQFVRAQAQDAVRQFFRPLTAPFQANRAEADIAPARRTRR